MQTIRGGLLAVGSSEVFHTVEALLFQVLIIGFLAFRFGFARHSVLVKVTLEV